MPDNFLVATAGGDKVLAADDIGGAGNEVLAQRVKISIGPDGSGSDVSATNPMPVTSGGDGVLLNSLGIAVPVKYVTAAPDTSNVTIVSAVSGRKIRVVSFFMHSATANSPIVTFKSGTTAITGNIQLTGGASPQVFPYNPGGWFETAVEAALVVTSASTAAMMTIGYIEY